jgi:polyisoprenoid-binding protein YceI
MASDWEVHLDTFFGTLRHRRLPSRASTTAPPLRHACARALAALLGLLPGAVALAAPAGYALDPVHTRILFAVSHAGFEQALGTVSGSTGTLLFDPDDWTSAKLSVSIPMTRLDLGDAKWNHAVSAHHLLDVAGHPVATFVSNKIEPKDPQHAAVCGTLTLRGVAQEVCLDVTFNQLKHHPMPPFRRTAGFSATTTLSRKAFGIDAWPTVIGDAVELRIEAEGARSSSATGEPEANAPAAAPVGENAAPAATGETPAAPALPPPPTSTDLPAPTTP